MSGGDQLCTYIRPSGGAYNFQDDGPPLPPHHGRPGQRRQQARAGGLHHDALRGEDEGDESGGGGRSTRGTREGGSRARRTKNFSSAAPSDRLSVAHLVVVLQQHVEVLPACVGEATGRGGEEGQTTSPLNVTLPSSPPHF